MLRVASLFVVVSACASSAPGARTLPSVPVTTSRSEAAARTLAAPKERASRLAPPFGPTAGVRRISGTSVAAAPGAAEADVLAAVDR
jgi:hypothetical protein